MLGEWFQQISSHGAKLDQQEQLFDEGDPLLDASSESDLFESSDTGLTGFDADTIHNILSSDDDHNRHDGDGDARGSLPGHLEPPNASLDPTEQELDNFLVQELNYMSMKERERAMYDIHGVSDVVAEDGAFVDERLKELDLAIAQIDKKMAYRLAESSDSAYVNNRNLRLKFLRADRFDPKLAAERYVLWFERKLELFGREKLTQDIKLSDLTASEVASLETGYFQILSERDRAGRSILCAVRSRLTETSLISRLRIAYYVYMASVEDEEDQKQGVVFVYFAAGPQKLPLDRRMAKKIPELTKSVPIRIIAVHACYDNPLWKPLLTLGIMAVEAYSRVRLRFHTGTMMEILYNLMTFGIPRHAFPVDSLGCTSVENHLSWVRLKQKQEETTNVDHIPPKISECSEEAQEGSKGSDPQFISIPKRMDVLLGRGKVIQEHPGNLRYRHLIETSRERYETSSKFEKTAVAEVIVKLIKESSGRFLKQDDDGTGWVEVTDEIAREKVAHAFRNRRKVKAGGSKSKVQNVDSSILSVQASMNKRQNPCAMHAGVAWMSGATSTFGVAPQAEPAKRFRF